MSVGRQICHRLIDTAEDLRRYGKLLDEFEPVAVGLLASECREKAELIESLIQPILVFEGEELLALAAGASS